ncbi:putative glycosyltransferase EpsJ [uncultured Blautia sp.]
MAKVSVIVPVYKVERYLERCVYSLIKQTYTDIEIILVDDGSPDQSGKICEELAKQDSRIHVIHQKNKGLSAARNAGLSVSSGKYISFVDSDDVVSIYFLEVLVNLMESYKVDLVACDRIDIYDEQIPVDEKKIYSSTSFSSRKAMEYLIKNQVIYQTVWDKLYRREVIQNLLFEEGKQHEDEFFTWKVIQRCNQVVHVFAPLYYYFHRKGSIMETFSKQRIDAFQARYERHLFVLDKYPELIIESKCSIELPCIFMMQKIMRSKNKQLCAEIKPLLCEYYKKCQFTKKELEEFPVKYKVNFYIANMSLELCAWLRNLLRRKS